MSNIIEILKNDSGLNKLWQDYKEKHQYSKKVKYSDVINALSFIEKEIKI